LAEADDYFETIREVLVDAACQSALQNNYSFASYKKNLMDSLLGRVLPDKPPELELEGTVSELAGTLRSDVKSGSAGKADVAAGCAIWQARSPLGG
jgi:hypothetical protein